MNKVKIYEAENEPVLGYKKGSKERLNVEKTRSEERRVGKECER